MLINKKKNFIRIAFSNALLFFFALGPAAATTLVVPEMSYSSSEGEDDFYDANDSPFTPGSQAPTPT